MRLSAARVFVRDLPGAVVFYRDVLGLALKHGGADAGFAVFGDAAAGVDLVVEPVEGGAQADEQVLVGRFTGLSFAVDDIEAAYRRLASAGVPFEEPPERQPWGGWLATFSDPAGNSLQLVQYPQRA